MYGDVKFLILVYIKQYCVLRFVYPFIHFITATLLGHFQQLCIYN